MEALRCSVRGCISRVCGPASEELRVFAEGGKGWWFRAAWRKVERRNEEGLEVAWWCLLSCLLHGVQRNLFSRHKTFSKIHESPVLKAMDVVFGREQHAEFNFKVGRQHKLWVPRGSRRHSIFISFSSSLPSSHHPSTLRGPWGGRLYLIHLQVHPSAWPATWSKADSENVWGLSKWINEGNLGLPS